MNELPWLRLPLERFEARLARGHAPQALLVHGLPFTGRRHFALTVAARLLGSPWRPAADVPAGSLAGVPHADYWEVGLEEEASVIKIDQILDLIKSLTLTSHGGGWRIGVISPAERLNQNAANALLKTLEEPPPSSTLILIADAPARLPPTILSRCEHIRLATPALSTTMDWLAQHHPDHHACQQAAIYASGAPLLARSLLADEGLMKLLAELGVELQQLVERRVPPTTLARTWARRDAGICLRWLYLQAADLLRRQAGAPAVAGPPLAPLKIPPTAVNMAACSAYLDQVSEAWRLKDRSLNAEAAFAELLMWWYGAAGAAR